MKIFANDKAEGTVTIPGVGEEDIVLFTRRHWGSMLGIGCLLVLMMLLPAVLILSFYLLSPNFFRGAVWNFVVIIGSIYYLVAMTFAFLEWINFYYDIFIFTQDEIIDINQEGFFNRQINQISLVNIQDVSAQVRGFLPTFFGYGDVVAESAGEKTQTYIIDKIPHPMQVADKILELHNEAVLRERAIRTSDHLAVYPVSVSPSRAEPVASAPSPPPPPSPSPTPPTQEKEISQEDLNKGGEIKI